MGPRAGSLLLAVALGLLGACSSAEERAAGARQAVWEAIARGERGNALAAIADLRAVTPETPEAQLELAQLMVRAGNAPEAGWLLEATALRHPERADVALASARVALLLGNPARAREVAAAIASEADEHAGALVLRAQAELQLGDLDQALATLAEAERLYPERPEVRIVRIQTLLKEHREEEARAALEEARAALEGEEEEETIALRRRMDVTLAQLRAQQGESEAALAALEELVAVDANDPLAWQALVQVLGQQKRAEEALARVEAALGSEDPPLFLHPLAARLHAGLGHDAEAEAALRAFAARSESAGAVAPLVELYAAREDFEAAQQVLDEALARFPEEPALRLMRTEGLLAEDDLEAARAELRRFRKTTFEGDPQIDYLEARIELAEGDAEAAAKQLRELAPRLDRAPTQFWLGRALEQSGDIEGAQRRYALAQRRDPHWSGPLPALIALEQRRGDWRAVAGHARQFLGRSPDQIGGWIALVEALENLGEGEAAEKLARQSLERFPDRAEPQELLARALRAQGKTDAALAALDEAERIEASPELAAERIFTLGMGGRVEEGLAVARAALAAEPDTASLHAAHAALLFATEPAAEGAQATDRALALDPDEPRPLRVRCRFRVASGRFAGARDDCTRYLAARAADSEAWFLLGLAHDRLGERAPALAAYRRAAQLDERDVRSRNNLAELLAKGGDLDGALAAAQEAYRLDEQSPYVMDTLGALYLEKGLPDRAVSLLEEAHAGLPELGEVTLHLALAYRDAGRPKDARTLLAGLHTKTATDAALRARVEEALDSLP